MPALSISKLFINSTKEWLKPQKDFRKTPWPLMAAISYILIIQHLGGLKTAHFLLSSTVFLYYYNEHTQNFVKRFFPFILTAVMFDSMRYYYWQGVEGIVRVKEPYDIEKALFGIYDSVAGKVVTPNEFFEFRIFKSLDLICGFAYLFFIFEYFSCAGILYAQKSMRVLTIFGWCFFLVNLMGFSTYFIYPAAPPWYVTKYGFGPAIMHAPPSAAACARFDEILGTHFFSAMYGEGIDVYGSIPSLHVSYPLLVFWATWTATKNSSRELKNILRGITFCFFWLMCFSAVYLQHHYVIDVVLGSLYALVALTLVLGVERGLKYGTARKSKI